GPEVLNWTAVDVHGLKVGDRVAYAGPIGGYSEVRLIVSRISGGEKLPVVFDSVGKDTFLRSLDCLRPRGLMVTFGQASGPIDPIAPVLLSQKGSLFLTRPFLPLHRATRCARSFRERAVRGGGFGKGAH